MNPLTQKLQKILLYTLVAFVFLFAVLYVMSNVFGLSWNFPCGPGSRPCSYPTYQYIDLYEIGYIVLGIGIGFLLLLQLTVYLASVLKKITSPIIKK